MFTFLIIAIAITIVKPYFTIMITLQGNNSDLIYSTISSPDMKNTYIDLFALKANIFLRGLHDMNMRVTIYVTFF